MMLRKVWMAGALVLALASTVSRSEARQIYISPMVGYTTAGSLELGESDLNDVTLSGGLTYGGQIGFQARPGFTFEASWMQQDAHLRISGTDVLGVTVGQLHGNFLFEKIGYGSTTHPYFLIGLGATFFNPDGDFDGEERFSFALGAGVKIEATSVTSFFVSGNTAEFEGFCKPSPCSFRVRVVDNGKPGTNDTFEIEIVGPFGTYTAADNLRSGDIHVHP